MGTSREGILKSTRVNPPPDCMVKFIMNDNDTVGFPTMKYHVQLAILYLYDPKAQIQVSYRHYIICTRSYSVRELEY